MKEIASPDLLTVSETSNTSIKVQLIGTAETSSAKDLDAFLSLVHDTALAREVKEVVIDLRALEFMNSSCFKTFVGWLTKLQDVPPKSQYRVRFQSDPRKHWQSRSLGALVGFAVDLIQIESK
jgi:hypothetical protein